MAEPPGSDDRFAWISGGNLKPFGVGNTTTLDEIAENTCFFKVIIVGIEYQINECCTVEEVEEVFITSGIRRPVGDLDRIQRMIDNSDVIITARDGKRLIGFLRAITDYSYCCYISDIAVNQDYQGLGIGKELIRLLRNKLGEEEIQYILTSAPKAVRFYEKIGFERADKAFVIKRLKN